MAADEVMLETAGVGVASLRFYGWSTPTLSLGYFQPAAIRHTDARLAGLPFVRRATGGDALVHHHELTYGIALPQGPPWQKRRESWVQRMHALIRATFQELGVSLSGCGEEKKLGPVLCFHHQTPCDLLLQSHKVVGSAQRKARGALLQHGAILLAQSPHTPSLPGLHELAAFDPSPPSRDLLIQAILTTLHEDTGWTLTPADWTPTESLRAATLVAEKYASPVWNAKR
jgi:lipoate-protein ligase A